MKSELKKDRLLEEEDSTQTFILQKYYDPTSTCKLSSSRQVAAETHEPLVCKRSKVTFNADRKFYTPAFIDPTEKQALAGSDERMRELFLEKVEENQSKKDIYIPKPSSHYCFVCREHFHDYFKHVAHPVHQKNIATSGPQDIIEELIEEFGRKHRRTPCLGFAESLEGPRKRVKVQEGQCPRNKEEAMFKDASTCLPRSSSTHQLNFYRN